MCFRFWTIWHCWCTYDHPSGLNLTNVVVNHYLVWVTAVTPIASQHNRFALLRFQWLSINKDEQNNKLDLCNITDTWKYTIIPNSFLSSRLLVVYFQGSVMLCKTFWLWFLWTYLNHMSIPQHKLQINYAATILVLQQ